MDHADEEIAAARFSQIRMFMHDAPFGIYEVPVPPSEPSADRPGKWRVCSPETVADFSAIGYFTCASFACCGRVNSFLVGYALCYGSK